MHYEIENKLVERVRLQSRDEQIKMHVAGDAQIDRLDLDFLNRSGKDTTLVIGELNPTAGSPSRLRIGSITGEGSSLSINSLAVGVSCDLVIGTVEIGTSNTPVRVSAHQGMISLPDGRIQIEVIGPTARLSGKAGSVVTVKGAQAGSQLRGCQVERVYESEKLEMLDVAPLGLSLIETLGPNFREISRYTPWSTSPPDSTPEHSLRAWAEAHERLMISKCPEPALVADARWLVWRNRTDHAFRQFRTSSLRQAEARAGNAVVYGSLRVLGYGLKIGPPAALWALAFTVVAVAFGISNGLGLDLAGIWGTRQEWATLFGEAIMLPAGLFNVGANQAGFDPVITGRWALPAKLITSIPFATMLLAMRTRFRLPAVSSVRL